MLSILDSSWGDLEKSWSTVRAPEIRDAIARLVLKCEDLIEDNIPENITRSAMENRLCSARRSWQQRLKKQRPS